MMMTMMKTKRRIMLITIWKNRDVCRGVREIESWNGMGRLLENSMVGSELDNSSFR